MDFPALTDAEFAEYWNLRNTALLYFQSMALHKASEVDLFTAVEDTGGLPDDVARHRGLDREAVARLLESLAAMGLLEVAGGRYSNTSLTRKFLVSTSPLSQRDMIAHTAITPGYLQKYDEIFRTGAQAPPPGEDAHPAEMVAAMHESALVAAPRLVDRLVLGDAERVLDLGGGAGTYSVCLAQRRPDLRAVVFDRPSVVGAARPYVEGSGVADRVDLQAGDFLVDPLGGGFSLALIVTVIHYLDPGALAVLVKRAADALGPGGRLVVSDILRSGDGDGPLREALYGILLMITRKGGTAHSRPEVEAAMRAAGLEVERFERLEPSLSSYVVGRKPA